MHLEMGSFCMEHDILQANVLDYALTKYLKSTKKLDEATIPKSINNIRGFILRIIYRHGTCTIKDILQEVTLSPSATTTALNHLEKRVSWKGREITKTDARYG